jgi:crotonobetainyl-CoA:carnitine CoA-transferase CaiB-like acyl-CoA transferase
LDVVQLQETAVNVAKAQWCAGQVPKSLDSIQWVGPDGTVYYGVTEDDYRAAPEWTRIYVVGNDEQWAVSCQQ